MLYEEFNRDIFGETGSRRGIGKNWNREKMITEKQVTTN
jgi:hypothetical protein